MHLEIKPVLPFSWMRMAVRHLIWNITYKLNMSKQQYRSDLGIISDILSVTMDCGRNGAIISSLSRRANLSHYAAVEKCQRLRDAGLVESTQEGRNHTFFITEKGVQFFQELQKFIENAKKIKIRLR